MNKHTSADIKATKPKHKKNKTTRIKAASSVSKSTLDHVRATGSQSANQKIDQNIIENIQLSMNLKESTLKQKIRELDKEWDIERILEMNASTIAFIGLLLGIFVNNYWLILPLLVLAFLFLHAVQGWCPPLPILRAIGKRTRKEIDTEKYALKILRGDFDDVKGEKEAKVIFNAVKR